MTSGASTAETLWIALAGGAVGVLLTGLAWGLVKVLAIPGELRQRNFEARIVNEDLELWAIDEYRRVRRELRKIENSPRPGQRDWIYSGAYGNARSHAKTEALHRWRDRQHVFEREMVQIESQENFLHRLVRKQRKYRDGLTLHAPDAVKPIIDELRQPITKHGQPRLQVFDPTRVELDGRDRPNRQEST